MQTKNLIRILEEDLQNKNYLMKKDAIMIGVAEMWQENAKIKLVKVKKRTKKKVKSFI